jgi:hypothetical protein
VDHCNSLRVIAGAPKRAAVAHNGIDAWAVGQVGVRQEPTHPYHIRTGTGPTPPTSAPGLGPPLPHPHRDWAHPAHICTGTGRTPLTSAPGLGSPGSHLHRDWAHSAHICTRTGLTRLTSAPGLGSPGSHLHQDWAHPAHICTRTGLTPLTHLHRHLGSALPHRYWDLSSVPCCCAAAARAPSTGPATRRGAQWPHLFAYIQRRLWHAIASLRADTKVSAASAAAGRGPGRATTHAPPCQTLVAAEGY